MKKMLMLTMFACTVLISTKSAAANHTDSLQSKHLVIKMELLDKQIGLLMDQLRSMQMADSIRQIEIGQLKQKLDAIPNGPQPRKLVIDRRGSKQAYFK